MRFSLGAILAICLAGLQFLAVMTVVFSSYLSSERALLDHARDLLSDVATNAKEHSSGFLKPARGAAELATRLAENRIVASENQDLLEKLLFHQLRTAPQFAGIFYGDTSGNFVYVMKSDGPGPFRSKIIRSDGTERKTELTWRDNDYEIVEQRDDPKDTYDPRVRPWYQNAHDAKGTIWTDPYIFFSSQRPGITVASPVFGHDGTFLGAIGVDIEINAISDFLSRLKIGESGTALILNSNGDVIAHPQTELLKATNADGSTRFANITEFGDPVARTAFGGLDFEDGFSTAAEISSQFDYLGNAYVSTVLPVISEQLPWTIAVFAPKDDFTQAIQTNRTRNIWIAVAIAAATGIIGLLLAERIHRPVRAFAVRSALISQGELPATAPLPRTYRELEDANQTLVDEIVQRKKTEREYGRTFDLASRGMAQIAPDAGGFIRVNSKLTDIFGYSEQELLEKSIADLVHPEDADLRTMIMEGGRDLPSHIQEMRCLHKNGDTVYISANTIMIRDDDGEPLHAVVTVDDITASKVAETQIEELNRDLSHFGRVNLMGQMASGLAHELNQPLTAITQNVDAALMATQDLGVDNTELTQILKELDQQAHRSGDIIKALRGFVKKDKSERAFFDLPALIRQTLRLISAEAKEHKVTISSDVANVPPVYGFRIQIAQVLVNLLRNGIEAISQGETTERFVKISAVESPDGLEVRVIDSGPGVDPNLDLFTQFETSKADGMGLGLSISRSIVEANGGLLWYEDNGSGNSCFCFTLKTGAT